MRDSSKEEADGRDGRLASSTYGSRTPEAGSEPAWSIICPLAATLVVVASGPVNRLCVADPFRAYPFCDKERPVIETESVIDPVVDELSVSVRVKEIDLVDAGDRKSDDVRALELLFATYVEIDGRGCP